MDVDAEDAVAETLYKVIKNIHKFDPGRGAKFSTWVFQITVNTTRDWCRKNSENSCLIHDADHLSIEPDKAQNKEELTEDGRLIRDAMSKLDETDRQILQLVMVQVLNCELGSSAGFGNFLSEIIRSSKLSDA